MSKRKLLGGAGHPLEYWIFITCIIYKYKYPSFNNFRKRLLQICNKILIFETAVSIFSHISYYTQCVITFY